MFATALNDLFGGRAAEAVLLHLFHYGERLTARAGPGMVFTVRSMPIQPITPDETIQEHQPEKPGRRQSRVPEGGS